jgi:hypothetical protein
LYSWILQLGVVAKRRRASNAFYVERKKKWRVQFECGALWTFASQRASRAEGESWIESNLESRRFLEYVSDVAQRRALPVASREEIIRRLLNFARALARRDFPIKGDVDDD